MLLKTKLTNAMQKYSEDYLYELKNITINGEKRGCSGFITNRKNGVVIYVNTENSSQKDYQQPLYRYAKHNQDFGGVHSDNHYAYEKDFAYAIHYALQLRNNYAKWLEDNKYDRVI